MTGIITLPLVPLRVSESELSEMCSQLLFGERVEIIEVGERWLFVRNRSDNYSGWVDRKMIQIISPEEDQRLNFAPSYCVTVPYLNCDKVSSKQKILLPGGSILPAYSQGRCKIGKEIYQISLPDTVNLQETPSGKIIRLALQYLNAPYLWGGKSILGIDCSGFIQVVFAMFGIQLGRDTSQQVESGKVIDFLFEAAAGDLAFFENAEGKIIHVGLLLSAGTIIHASGSVKIESIDSQGIISSQTGEYTHTLRVIKRLL